LGTRVTTPNLQLIEPPDSDTGGQGGSGEAFRESFRVLDSLSTGWMAVLSSAVTVPPAAPIQGATYLVPVGATGVWADHVRHLAIFTPAGWVFRPPRKGWIVVALNENTPFGKVYQYNGTQWVAWQMPAAQIAATSGGTVQAVLDDHEARIDVLELGGGGGSGALEFIGSDIAVSAAASLTVASIPDTFSHLMVIFQGRGDASGGNPWRELFLQFNGDTGANYDWEDWHIFDSGSAGVQGVAQTRLKFGSTMPSAGASASRAIQAQGFVANYAGATFFKTCNSQMFSSYSTGGFTQGVGNFGGVWRNTGAVSQITMLPENGNFVAGSGMWVYGIA
jgi:hypothetical protein